MAIEPTEGELKHVEELDLWLNSVLDDRLNDAKLVEVWTGAWFQSGDAKPQARTIRAILLSDSVEIFEVFDISKMQKLILVKSKNVNQPHKRVTYEKVDIQRFINEAKEGDVARPNLIFLRENQLGLSTSRAIVACVAHRMGRTDEAIEIIRTIPKKNRRGEPVPTVKQVVSENLSHLLMWNAVRSFGDTKVSRKDLLHEFRRVFQHFPESGYADRAAKDNSDVAEDDSGG